MKRLLLEVLKDIKPSEETVLKTVNRFTEKLNLELKKKQLNAIAVIGGSIAKGTFLKGDFDCDIFVKFNYERYKNYDISSLLRKALVTFKPILVHGSRDYFHIKKKINYEIVPVLDIADPKKAMNVTDMSPMHVAWVKASPTMQDEIRLSKQFCKAQGVYGAESYIKGFSGHVLDILTIKYGGFEELLKASKNWKGKTVIDTANFHKGRALKNMNKAKLDGPLIVVDPVLPDRNAAAALGEEKYNIFKKAAELFLQKPSKSFFSKKKLTLTELKNKSKGKKLVLLDITPLKGKEDVIGAKLLKAYMMLKNQLNFNDFKVEDSGWTWEKKPTNDKALFWFILDKKDLYPMVKRVGPPSRENTRVQDFRKKHQKTFLENGRVCTQVERNFVSANKFISFIIKNDKIFKEKIRGVKLK